MNVFDNIKDARVVRDYSTTDVSIEKIKNILEAGRLTPSSMNTQPWHFILVKDKNKLQKLADSTPTGQHIAQSNFAIIVLTDLNSNLNWADCGRAVQNMVLTAWNLGVGHCWICNFDEKVTRKLLDYPENLGLLCLISMGYPKNPTKPGKKRKNHDLVISTETYGKSLF
tara:strand:+ start:111 stop:617 length:507 start_codon:yes stop_codon:yes gene_type:complete